MVEGMENSQGISKRNNGNTKINNKTACNGTKAEARPEVIEVFHKTIRHFFPYFSEWIDDIADPRQVNKTKYNTAHLFWAGTLLFLLKLGSRRQINFQFYTEEFKENLNLLSGGNNERVAHDGTLENLLRQSPPGNLSRLRQKMLKHLIRMKALESYRLLAKYYLISIDGTGYLAYGEKRHCAHCLTKKVNGKTYYYHNVLDAKLVTGNGFALSAENEMIENTPYAQKLSVMKKKQDCELKAFYRLTPELKKEFPQLKICLLLDSLYACDPVFKICDKYGWKYIITFKEGSMRDTFAWYESLKKNHQPENKALIKHGEVTQKFSWVTEMKYRGPEINILECNERQPGKDGLMTDTRFLWITNLKINECNFEKIAKGGRLRWKIENEGFNVQKNGGYNLEHSYSRNETASKNYYLLLQIAHIINQLMEKGSLLKNQIRKTFGSIRNIARQLLEDFRTKILTPEKLQSCLATPFQIRFSLPP